MFALPRPRSPIRTPTLHKTIAPPLLEVACLRGGGGGVSAVEIIDALKSAAAAWFAASVVYLTTLQWSDTRQSASQRPLPDLGFQFVPAVAGAGAAADVLGSAMALYLVGTGIFGGAAGLECFRRSLVYCAGGMLFPPRFTATTLPDSDPAPAPRSERTGASAARASAPRGGPGPLRQVRAALHGRRDGQVDVEPRLQHGLAAHFMAVRGVIPRFCVPLWVAGGVLRPNFERCGAGKQGDIGSIVYYTAAQYYEVTNGTATLTLEEVFDTSDDKTMETANLWHLAKKFHDYGAVLFAFWVPLFAGVLAPLAIFLHLYGVFFHNSRERMSRKFELVHGMGRMGFSYPIFVALFAAVVGFKATSDDKVIDNSSDTEEIVIGAEWDVRILAKICHGAPYFAGVLCAAQLLARFIYVIGRTERPIPSPSVDTSVTFELDLALVTEFQDVKIDAEFDFSETVDTEISACDISTYMDAGNGIGQNTAYANALANLLFWGLIIGMWDFFIDSPRTAEDNIASDSMSPEAAYAALIIGAFLEAATSSWIRWRLQCELEDGTGPARLRTFRDWLFSADDAEPPLNKEQEESQFITEESKEQLEYYQQD
ncbi:sulfuric ester hydrolase [Aureococcus anophagefferens]|nr:sulfuric ester hydrolase [Aureococcus anophagefferens]